MHGHGRLALLFLGLLVSCARDGEVLAPDRSTSSSEEATPQPILQLLVADLEEPDNLVLRWKGDANGPLPDSPEQSAFPTFGFGRGAAFEWQVEMVDGLTLGAMVRASQAHPRALVPADAGLGETATFALANDTPPELLPSEGCDDGPDCPGIRRWESGRYEFEMLAMDALGRLRSLDEGLFTFDANYPPESSIVFDEDYPGYLADDGLGGFVANTFAEGDTIPVNSYVVFRRDGYDRFEGSVDNPDSFCCDERVDPLTPEVRFQTRLEFQADEGFRTRDFATLYSSAEVGDTLGFPAGPFAYHVSIRTVDEHTRPDESPETFDFVAGHLPRIDALSPSGGAAMILRDPSAGSWPENEVPYDVPIVTVTRYWDGEWFQLENGLDRIAVSGHLFPLRLQFDGSADPREPASAVRAWAYRLQGEYDPENVIPAPGESDDFSFYANSAEPNLQEVEVEIFVPALFWSLPELFEPDSPDADYAAMGAHLRAWLGAQTLQCIARTTQVGETFTYHARVRPPDLAIPVNVGLAGRRSSMSEATFGIHLGLDPSNTGTIQRLWPDEEVRP